MVRSGTTLIQRLLARDPRLYCVFGWEIAETAPRPGTSWDQPDPLSIERLGDLPSTPPQSEDEQAELTASFMLRFAEFTQKIVAGMLGLPRTTSGSRTRPTRAVRSAGRSTSAGTSSSLRTRRW